MSGYHRSGMRAERSRWSDRIKPADLGDLDGVGNDIPTRKVGREIADPRIGESTESAPHAKRRRAFDLHSELFADLASVADAITGVSAIACPP